MSITKNQNQNLKKIKNSVRHETPLCSQKKHFDRPSFSAIREHSMSCAPIALDGFQILARGNTDIELLIKESLLIADQRPILNSNISSLELCVFN